MELSCVILGKSLLWVAVLGLVVLYIYAVVSFAFIHESFLAPDNDDATLFCSTLYECFASTIRYGLIDNLGLVIQFHYYCALVYNNWHPLYVHSFLYT